MSTLTAPEDRLSENPFETSPRCETCNQINVGQIGEYPCPSCGVDTQWDHVSSITGAAIPLGPELIGLIVSPLTTGRDVAAYAERIR